MKLYDEDKLNQILEYIKDYQKQEGRSPSYREVGQAVGIKNSGTISRYIKQLELRGEIRKTAKGTIAIENKFFSGKTRTVALVGTVACGQPIFADENIEGNYQLPVELFGNTEHFMLRAKGESMIEKGIFDGDIIVVRKQNVAERGQVVVALIEDEATAKIFMRQNNQIILRAANNSVDEKGNRCYPDILTDKCEILGIVDHVIHKII